MRTAVNDDELQRFLLDHLCPVLLTPSMKPRTRLAVAAVSLLRVHIDRNGMPSDGRLLAAERAVVPSSACGRIWREARTYALTPQEVASSVVESAYNCGALRITVAQRWCTNDWR
jgi:hypothetical protein